MPNMGVQAFFQASTGLPGKKVPQAFQGFSPVTDSVLDVHIKLGQRFPIVRNQKERIVPEPTVTPGAVKYNPVQFSLENPARTVRETECHSTTKRCCPLLTGNPRKLTEQPFIVIRVTASFACKSSRKYPGTPIEGIHHQPRIISQYRDAGRKRRGHGLFTGIGFESGAVFRHRRDVGKIRQRIEPFDAPVEDSPDFGELPLISGGNQEFPQRSRASLWISNNRVMPEIARSRIASISRIVNGFPSAVPCTSTNRFEEVMTKFISTSAAESSW